MFPTRCFPPQNLTDIRKFRRCLSISWSPLPVWMQQKSTRLCSPKHKISCAGYSALTWSILNLCHMVAWLSCNHRGIRQVLTNVSVIRKKWSNVCTGSRFAAVGCFIIAPASVFTPEHAPQILSFFSPALFSKLCINNTLTHWSEHFQQAESHTFTGGVKWWVMDFLLKQECKQCSSGREQSGSMLAYCVVQLTLLIFLHIWHFPKFWFAV